MKKTSIIIPARYASSRLPGKPLLAETGKPLIQHTWEQACAVPDVDSVHIATDDQRIAAVVENFGGNVVMTSPDHSTGSARVAEAALKIDADIIVNIQGDEPEIDPAIVHQLINLQKKSGTFASTLACPFPAHLTKGPGSPDDTSAVKVVTSSTDKDNIRKALYFSRQKIPYTDGDHDNSYFMHIGIYAFSKQSLQKFANHPHTPLEKTERLEQLRILEMAETISVFITDSSSPGIDTPEDYASFVKRVQSAMKT